MKAQNENEYLQQMEKELKEARKKGGQKYLAIPSFTEQFPYSKILASFSNSIVLMTQDNKLVAISQLESGKVVCYYLFALGGSIPQVLNQQLNKGDKT